MCTVGRKFGIYDTYQTANDREEVQQFFPGEDRRVCQDLDEYHDSVRSFPLCSIL